MSGSPDERLRALLNGYQATEALHAAAALSIPDLIANGVADLTGLARETGTHSHSLRRLMSALTALEVVRLDAERYTLTAIGERLKSDARGGWHHWALLIGSSAIRAAWAHAVPALRTGTTGFESAHGTDIWTYRSRRPEERAMFDRAMRAGTERLADSIAGCVVPMSCKRIADVGGGDGTLLAHLLHRHAGVTGILLEQGESAASARRRFADEGLLDRAEVIEGDFFREAPSGADLYILKFVIHDWDDQAAVAILENCRLAARRRPYARIAIVERLLDSDAGRAEAALSDLNMLVNTGGRERTITEYRALLQDAGLRLHRVQALVGNVALLDCAPVGN